MISGLLIIAMLVAGLKQSKFIEAYGILCSALPSLNSREGLYPTFCRILEGAQSLGHSHFEPEIFFVVEGRGRMMIGGEAREVQSGDLVRIPSFAHHELTNLGSGELVFLSVYSEDTAVPRLPASVQITAAPPTPNGPLHLGHISGPYLAADVMSRYLRLRSAQVVSHSGSDDHQNYVAERALAIGKESESFRTEMRERIQAGLRQTSVQFDEFIEPKSDVAYLDRVRGFAGRVIESGVAERVQVEFPHCEKCDLFLFDARLSGLCPKCGEASSGGCESCGWVVTPMELCVPSCNRCGQAAHTKSASVHRFPLHRFIPAIQDGLTKLPLPDRLRQLVQEVSQQNEVYVLLTEPNGSIHVWFEMAAHYDRFASSSDFWIHSFGFDNAFYYLIFIPALLKVMNGQAKLPDAVLTNEFLHLDGKKFSTSRGHAIWADEFADNTDHLRLFLGLNRPATATTNFSDAKFRSFSVELEELLESVRKLAISSKSAGSDSLIQCNRITRDFERLFSPEHFDLRRASRRLLELMDMIVQSGGDRLMIRTLAILMTPILPNESKKILKSLGLERAEWFTDWARAE